MAELPRYRPLGAAISSMPSVDFVQTGRAQAQVYSSITDALNKVSEFAFEKAVAEAKREGVQYGYNNPLTEDQINMALSNKLDINDVVQDPGTIFGAASRAGTAARLRVDLEAQMRNQVAGINAIIDGGGIVTYEDVGKIEAQLQGNIAGYSNLLAQMDPDEAASFSATANTIAASTYKNALESVLKTDMSKRRIDAERSLDQLDDVLYGVIKSSAGGDIDIDKEIQVAVKGVRETIIATNDIDFINSKANDVDDKIIEAKQNFLVDFAFDPNFAKNRVEASTKLANGDFGRYTNVYNSLDETQQAIVRQRIRTERQARDNDKTANDNAQMDIYKGEAAILANTIAVTAFGSKEEQDAIEKLAAIHVLSDGQLGSPIFIQSLLDAKTKQYPEPENKTGEITIRRQVYSGLITTQAELIAKSNELGLSSGQILSMMPLLETETKNVMVEADRALMALAKIVPNTTPSEEKAASYFRIRAEANKRLEERLSEWETGGSIGRQPTLLDIVKEMTPDVVNSPAQQKIDTKVKALNRDFGASGSVFPTGFVFTEDTNFDDIESVLKKLGAPQNVINDIKDDLNIVKDLQGKLMD